LCITRWIGGLAGSKNSSAPLSVTAFFHPDYNSAMKSFLPVQVATVVKTRRKCPLIVTDGSAKEQQTNKGTLVPLPGASAPLKALLFSVMSACEGVKVR